MKMKISRILILVLLMTSCKSNQTENKDTALNSEKVGFVLNPKLIDGFYRDEWLYPENPELTNYRVKEFIADLNQNQKQDTLILYKLNGFENDPGDFHQIEIKLDNGESWMKTNFDGWVRFDNNYPVPDFIKEQNQFNTDFLLLTDFGKTKLIGLFSWVYASEPGLLTFIEFSNGKPRIMFNKKFDLTQLESNKITVENYNGKYQIELIDNNLELKKQQITGGNTLE
nr:hypothetical protein [uncultured Carboxylicivirga sp.]